MPDLLLLRVDAPLPPTVPIVVALFWLTLKAANWAKSQNKYLRRAGGAVLLGLTAVVFYLAFKFVEALIGLSGRLVNEGLLSGGRQQR